MDNQGRRVMALGFFDGVHAGHGKLLACACEVAQARGLEACVFTFENHPDDLITGYHLPLINTVEDRRRLISGLYGVRDIVFVPFDRAMMRMPWNAFIRDVLIGRYGAAHVVAGHDFYFGYKGEGSPQKLKHECEKLGVGCDIVKRLEIDGVTVSSTYIRKLIALGDMERAALFLGHPHELTGRVGRGRRVGTALGLPTANLVFPDALQRPALGVYATRTVLDGKGYRSVTNVGVRPTFGAGGAVTVETALFDFSGDLYGREITVEFYKFLREEAAFAAPSALRAQMLRDAQAARDYLGGR